MKKLYLLLALFALVSLACESTLTAQTETPDAQTKEKTDLFASAKTITAPTDTAAPAHVMQTVGSVNLRSGAGMSHAVIRVLAADTEVITIGGYVVADDGGQWVKVRLVDADVIGYVNIDLL